MEPMQKRAHLVAFIGIDGAGKTTQTRLLAEWLRAKGYPVVLHPNESLQPARAMFNDIAHRMGYEDYTAMLGLETRQLITAVLKWNTMIKVREELAVAGQFVVMDRYTFCQVAAARYLQVENAWLIQRLFDIFPQPDLTLFIDITAEEALRRGVKTPPLSFIKGHSLAYRELPEAKDFVFVNGERAIETVRDEIREHMKQRFPFLV